MGSQIFMYVTHLCQVLHASSDPLQHAEELAGCELALVFLQIKAKRRQEKKRGRGKTGAELCLLKLEQVMEPSSYHSTHPKERVQHSVPHVLHHYHHGVPCTDRKGEPNECCCRGNGNAEHKSQPPKPPPPANIGCMIDFPRGIFGY